MLIKNEKTDYVILVPEKTDTFIDFAVKTLNDAMEKSTGVKFDVVTEANEKFISIGNTRALKEFNPEIKYGKDGFTVRELNGNLYLFGQSVYGPIWAVYGLLEKTVGYKFFTPDEIKIESRDEIDVTGLDITYTPTLSNRCSGFGLAKYNLEYATGLKAYAWYGQRLDGKYFWGSWAHNHVGQFVQPKKYYKDHPEWFVQVERFYAEDPENMRPDRMALCLSNLEMRDEFFKNLIECIKVNDHATHFILGHEDWDVACYCDKCKEMINKLGESGLQMHFVNDMARRVEQWRLENCPDRDIAIGTFAYDMKHSFKPPVKYENGKYVPVDPSVVAEPNVFIMFAPIAAPEHARSVTDESNKVIMTIMDKWKLVCDRVALWLYYGSFRRAHEFVDGIYRFKGDIEYYKSMGCECFYVESPSVIGYIAFQAMTLYVLTSQEWDNTLDTDELIKEFCDNYYKEASPYILKYFYYLMDYHKKVRARIEYLTGKKYTYGVSGLDTIPQGFWDLNAVYDLSMMLDDAEKAIKEAGYDESMCEKILDRIEVERMTLLHVQLEYFNRETSVYDEARSVNTYPKEKILELCDRFERNVKKFGYKSVNGDGTALETIEGWRKRAENAARGWQDRIDNSHAKFEEWSKEFSL